METTLYDHKGNPVCYLENDGIFYLFDGKQAGYIEENIVYAFTGHHLGWFEEGWIRDHKGRRVFYTSSATGSGPVTPTRHAKPLKASKRGPIKKEIRHRPRVKPVKSSSWSALSGEMFFYQ
ncbi:MAG: hypothetical protein EHM28_13840 [Spirochaetaceae bacterium]|nr:MAG: hypothetical protein EHM28_13840 [Spirochaetaceae bacterium]